MVEISIISVDITKCASLFIIDNELQLIENIVLMLSIMKPILNTVTVTRGKMVSGILQ